MIKIILSKSLVIGLKQGAKLEEQFMEIIAMYLPQFHRVKENDMWWGEGFTEWTTVKKAQPLYEGHYQPHEPMDDNYYNLLDKSTMQKQAEQMHEYGIDAMCFYHYWFKDGRRILEKPAENLLEWTDIDMPFCFCWANETWARSWSQLEAVNSWADTFDGEKKEGQKAILLEQRYGEEKDWKEHFEYFLPFFEDSRYLRFENKPVIVLYRPEFIYCIDEMLSKWREWALEAGLEGLYIIGGDGRKVPSKSIDAVVNLTANSLGKLKRVRDDIEAYNYADFWENILHTKNRRNVYYQGIVTHDASPRRGKRGMILEESIPDAFRIYFAKLLAKSYVEKKEYVFLNAWNEWGEGMYLEPDKRYGYQYLEAVKWAKEHYVEYLKEFQDTEEEVDWQELYELEDTCNRYRGYWRLLDEWLKLKEEKRSIADYLVSRGYQSVAVYGMGMMGRHLLEELRDSEIEIKYIVDRKKEISNENYQVYSPEEALPEDIDVMIISTTYDYEKIENSLDQKGNFKYLHLERLVKESRE